MSYAQFLRGRAIRTGCEWRLKIQINSSALELFPANAKFRAQLRRSDTDPTALATLTTENGGVVRVDGSSLELVLTGVQTVDWSAEKVVMDILRTDAASPIHLGFDLVIPVKRTVTSL